MSTEKGNSSSHPLPPEGRDSETKPSVLFTVLLAGAILALVFVTAITALVLWRAGFFTSKNGAVARVENKNVDSRSASGLVLHIQSKGLNVLDGKSLITESTGEVRSGDGYLVISDSESLRLQGSITVSAWFKARSFEKAMTVAGRAQNGPPWRYPFLSWLIRINTDSVVEGDVGDGRSYSPAGWAAPTLLPEQWYFVCMTYDGNTKALFLNGLLQNRLASGSLNFSGTIGYTPGKPTIIGADESENPVGDVFDGAIDDVRIFDRALQAEEVQSLFKEGTKKYRIN